MMAASDVGNSDTPEAAGLLRPAATLRYLSQLDAIEGWCEPTTALAMAEMLWQQERDGVTGGIAEIGVHHGKSFLALALAARPQEHLVAIDLFEHQDLNVDLSGRGDRQAFLANLERFAPGRDVRLVATSSTDLWGREEELGLRGLRFLSVDGGHTRDLTLNDLRLANSLLVPDGLCLLDDILNPHWTGVVSGAFAFLGEAPDLVPCALVPNKLVLCRPARRDHWRAVLRVLLGPALERRDQEFDAWLIDVYGHLPARAWPHRTLEDARQQSIEINSTLGQLTEQLEAEATARRSLEAEVTALRSSTSWRITAPLRALRRITGQ